MIRSLALCALLAAPLTAQAAAFVRYGNGCLAPAMVLEPTITHTGLPRLGGVVTIEYAGMQGALGTTELVPVLLTGFSTAQDPLPRGLLPQQRPGCTIWLKPEFATPMAIDPSRPGQFLTHLTMRVPNHPSVLGLTWFHQWIVASVHCPGSGAPCVLDAIGATDAAQLTVGF